MAGFSALLFSRLRLPDCPCFSAQSSHLVWPSMARSGPLTHLPVSLAILFDSRRFCRLVHRKGCPSQAMAGETCCLYCVEKN